MFLNAFGNVYGNFSDLPINSLMLEWGKKHHPELSKADIEKPFKSEYWDKLSQKEQQELLEKQEEAIQKDAKLMQEEILKNFSKSSHSYKEYYDVAKKARDIYIKQNPGEEVEEVPNITLLSDGEKNKRKELQEKALKVFAEVSTNIVQNLRRHNSVRFMNSGVKQMDRGVKNMCHTFDENGKDEYEKNLAILEEPLIELPKVLSDTQGLNEQQIKQNEENKLRFAELKVKREAQENKRRDLLDKILKDNLEFAKSLRTPMTDEEFFNKYGNVNDLNRLQSIGEIQVANYDTIVDIFKVKPSKEVEDTWRKMNDEIIADSAMFNRLGTIANPLYSEIANPEEAVKLFEYIGDNGPVPDIYEIVNYDLGINEQVGVNITDSVNLQKFRENPESGKLSFVARNHYESAANFSCTKNALYSVVASAKIPSIISTTYNVDSKNIKYTDLDGKELNLREAYDRMYDGKTCKVYDKSNNKYLGGLEGGTFDNVWGGLKEPDTPANYRLKTADPEELVHNIKGLNAEINNATHWYMSSSKEFTNLRKAMAELQKPEAFNDINKAKENMKNIVKLANDYIKLKEDGKAEITDNTKKRLAIAHKIANNFERTLTEAELVKENNKGEVNNDALEREQVVIEEANFEAKQEIVKEIQEPALEILEEKVMEQ